MITTHNCVYTMLHDYDFTSDLVAFWSLLLCKYRWTVADSSVLDLGIEHFATTVVENGSIRLIVPKKNVFTTYCRKVQLGFFFFFLSSWQTRCSGPWMYGIREYISGVTSWPGRMYPTPARPVSMLKSAHGTLSNRLDSRVPDQSVDVVGWQQSGDAIAWWVSRG